MVNSVKEDAPKKRSPCYSRDEMVLLLELVEKYQTYIQTKSTNAVANHAKEIAWIKLARQFNNANLGHIRSADTLKSKWENMKKNVRNASKNLLDTDSSELDDLNSRVIALIAESNSTGSIEALPGILEEEIDESEMNANDALKYGDSDVSKDVDSDTDNDQGKRFRSQNFSPQESKLLLQCVRKEKKIIFNRETTTKANHTKSKAWSRIADSYNKLSPLKRSAKCLRIKFESMKKMARKIGTKDMVVKELFKNGQLEQNHKSYEELIDDSIKGIKKEPSCEEKMEEKSDQFSDNDSDSDYNNFDRENKFASAAPDPLSSVLHGDSAIGSSSSQMSSWNWNQSENKEIVQLQKELLNYQMETAKLERKRVEDAIAEEALERESRALERSLRVRAARLEAAAGALRLPPAHPALAFPPEEASAHRYLAHSHHASPGSHHT